ncbi:MAG: DEAD/DEAH box helicase [Rhodospirillaceae bacterium]|jgi:superfamily II DNA/RNA helicase|nr:DEAD/DEAH box helicase [Rhodospirillaceae bacterium]MBT4463051.1 DEAD/DEAH box helicase [Rhodospirillaceae bacterium]MBT5013371.1 DEAD/DEAH box helicase [Rhodospirillaceae bacterium]MBT7354905.1 DEAD/DEAH box helicase [Rhodospirillaceae bacterium]
MNFRDLGLGDDVLNAVEDAGYITPTPIQAQAIPTVLMGRDILGCAQTGTGKTAGFTLPMIDILASGRAKARMPRSLILEPTRELAAQVADNFDTYGKYHKLTKVLLIGGTSMNEQMKIIERGPDVLIATPGRLLDLFERGRLLLNDVKTLVIDEADRMLDMGFIPDVEKIVSLVSPMRQTLFFSATMAPEIRRLADKFLMNPKEITVAAVAPSDETITQGLIMVPHGDGRRPGGGQKEKRAALRKLIAREDVKDAIIFCNRKRDIGTLYRSMKKHGYSVGQLHGDMDQSSRTEMLKNFKDKKFTYMICSDVAARGLDIPALSHVFNFDVPTHAEDYIHRIGRTGRAGIEGHAYTIAVAEDGKYLDAITKLIKKDIPSVNLDSDKSASPAPKAKEEAKAEATPEADKSASSDDTEEPRERAPRRRRRGGRGRNKNFDQNSAQPENTGNDAPKEAAKEASKNEVSKNDAPKQEPPKQDSNNAQHKKSFGMGDHVPAFMKPPGEA